MTMKFCPKCKNILVPHSIGEKSIVFCKNCGFSAEGKAKPLVEEEDIEQEPERGEGVLKGNPFATYKHKCKKCGYGKAQIIDSGVYVSDEDNLIMLKCGKCGYAERVGRRTM